MTNRPGQSTDDDYSGLRRMLASSGGKRDVPPDVEPGSDADVDRDGEQPDVPGSSDPGSEAREPSPGDDAMEDNLDELGDRPDGKPQDQPGAAT